MRRKTPLLAGAYAAGYIAAFIEANSDLQFSLDYVVENALRSLAKRHGDSFEIRRVTSVHHEFKEPKSDGSGFVTRVMG